MVERSDPDSRRSADRGSGTTGWCCIQILAKCEQLRPYGIPLLLNALQPELDIGYRHRRPPGILQDYLGKLDSWKRRPSWIQGIGAPLCHCEDAVTGSVCREIHPDFNTSAGIPVNLYGNKDCCKGNDGSAYCHPVAGIKSHEFIMPASSTAVPMGVCREGSLLASRQARLRPATPRSRTSNAPPLLPQPGQVQINCSPKKCRLDGG